MIIADSKSSESGSPGPDEPFKLCESLSTVTSDSDPAVTPVTVTTLRLTKLQSQAGGRRPGCGIIHGRSRSRCAPVTPRLTKLQAQAGGRRCGRIHGRSQSRCAPARTSGYSRVCTALLAASANQALVA